MGRIPLVTRMLGLTLFNKSLPTFVGCKSNWTGTYWFFRYDGNVINTISGSYGKNSGVFEVVTRTCVPYAADALTKFFKFVDSNFHELASAIASLPALVGVMAYNQKRKSQVEWCGEELIYKYFFKEKCIGHSSWIPCIDFLPAEEKHLFEMYKDLASPYITEEWLCYEDIL